MMTSQSQAKEKLHHVTSVVTEPEDNVKFYDEWAETFDELSKLGYRNIDGLDASQKSLDVAARKDIMNELICVWVDDKTIKIASDCYDGLICVGGFVPGHLHSDCFDEWIRIVKPGGVIVNVLRQQWLDEYEPYANNQLEDDMKQKERSMKWELIQRGNFDGGDQQWKMAVFIHKVL
ncbi:uncharacterized protein [Antedon mediterranea]|uniref:uncharacterized protein isoform X2 n=1 Tax=Antedon mediterranea TaxID=105859 RepID=UPI003AF49D06